MDQEGEAKLTGWTISTVRLSITGTKRIPKKGLQPACGA